MTCFECCKEIQTYPCACGYQPKGPTGLNWVIQHCTRAGCSSAIRVPAGQQESLPACKWCQAIDLHGDPYAIYNKTLYPRRTA
jgi:hypothetical protein